MDLELQQQNDEAQLQIWKMKII